jgi:osmotically-inducible protein OsmY
MKRYRIEADSWITAKVKADLFNEPSLKAAQIDVESRQNMVRLSGVVDATASMNKALAIARSVKGVISVENQMQFRRIFL